MFRGLQIEVQEYDFSKSIFSILYLPAKEGNYGFGEVADLKLSLIESRVFAFPETACCEMPRTIKLNALNAIFYVKVVRPTCSYSIFVPFCFIYFFAVLTC